MFLFPSIVDDIIAEYCGWDAEETMMERSDISPDGKWEVTVKEGYDGGGVLMWDAKLTNTNTKERAWMLSGFGHVYLHPIWSRCSQYFIVGSHTSGGNHDCVRVDIRNDWLNACR